LKAVESEDFALVEREIDWVIKWKLIDRYRSQNGLPLSHPRIAQLDLAYHDIHRGRGLYYLLERRGAVTRVTNDLQVFEAKSVPPQTTRARLRGEFIKRAQERRRDFTVDWVHLKLNDQAQRTVLCKDPFRAHDERVHKLIEGMYPPSRPPERLLSGGPAIVAGASPLPPSAPQSALRCSRSCVVRSPCSWHH
jgi:proteasome accessory factor A